MASLRDMQQRYAMRPLDENALIELWDSGDGRHPVDRALVMLDAACDRLSWEELAALPLGRRDSLLLTLRGLLFGDRVLLCGNCPDCGKPAEFIQSLAELLSCDSGEEPPASMTVSAQGVNFSVRAPTSLDLAALYDALGEFPHDGISGAGLIDAGHRALLRRCASPMAGDGIVLDDAATAALAAEVSRAVDVLDPMAVLVFPLTCPYCGHAWQPIFDVPALLWAEIVNSAKRALHDVRQLAKSFGWSEREILRMSRSRRRYYLEQASS